ncbi:hypothetical protein [Pelotalea chapellei]|uniref:Uncharacterized protein n=1 Tax=Pelotalea chapellei TaxID=44671 RepID=A0ABS5UA63_9BACT|nr:hypothetical protein [Pelotalea chapellei]MBT1072540.1 hypothetical protein [Pelotalea chapellei]
MTANSFDSVCYRTEQREEQVALRNLKNGEIGYSFGCTHAGETIQVRLLNGEMDSWNRFDCIEDSVTEPTVH